MALFHQHCVLLHLLYVAWLISCLVFILACSSSWTGNLRTDSREKGRGGPGLFLQPWESGGRLKSALFCPLSPRTILGKGGQYKCWGIQKHFAFGTVGDVEMDSLMGGNWGIAELLKDLEGWCCHVPWVLNSCVSLTKMGLLSGCLVYGNFWNECKMLADLNWFCTCIFFSFVWEVKLNLVTVALY